MSFLESISGSGPSEQTSQTNVSLPFVKDFVWGMFDPSKAKDPRIAAIGQWLAGLQPEYQKAFMEALSETSYDSRATQADRFASAQRRQADIGSRVADRSYGASGMGSGFRAGAQRAAFGEAEDRVGDFLRELYSPESELRRRMARLGLLQAPSFGPMFNALGQAQGLANQVQTYMKPGSTGILGSIGSLAGLIPGGGQAAAGLSTLQGMTNASAPNTSIKF